MSQNTVAQENDVPKLQSKLAEYEKQLQQKDVELQNAKAKISQLEDMVTQVENLKQQRLKDAEEVDCLKTESEKTLTKAKSIIFERTKVIKNQELQIEALSQQNESLKDVVRITKDLLEIRNLEVKQLENKINCMEERMKAEKERQDLMHKKLETMIRHNGELKREYEAQLCLFQALRERYNERELARGVIDNMRKDIEAEKAGNASAPVNGQVENAAQVENQNAENSQAGVIEAQVANPENIQGDDKNGQGENPQNGQTENAQVGNGENAQVGNAENAQVVNQGAENSQVEVTEGQVTNAENIQVGDVKNGQVESPENVQVGESKTVQDSASGQVGNVQVENLEVKK